ncbi:glycosyltransferase family 9 protein [Sphingomonas oryzagri]|uniref:Glycosyltransferase family 9 protein n=1 Tax=Sphingomonas oryzagri TaxID=3042314 RepID=A0ABT6MW73_9SPHN|nr:glycosyltransferase family 9 protein [Sphingomonas oryzagri]MDH7637268.1 glycosyltransferase family 9 protein [Sphingomonas oryzagri]
MKICVFQNWGLGDLVMTVPVVAEMRRLYPQAEITLIVRGGPQRALMEGAPVVDRILSMPKNGERAKLLGFFRGLRKYRFDCAYIGTRITPLSALLLRVVAGVRTIVGDSDKLRWLYAHAGRVDPAQHRVDRMLETLSLWTGQPAAAPSFPLPLSDKAKADGVALLADLGVTPGGFLAIHPGSSKNLAGEKRIPVDMAKALIARVRAEVPGAKVVVMFGPDDLDLVPAFEPFDETVVAVKNVPLDVTKAVLAEAACFVGSDSALGHIAAAFGVPTVTLAGPTIPTETRPYGAQASVLTRGERLPCQPCWGTALHGKCPYDAQCMRDIPGDSLSGLVIPALAAAHGREPAHASR